MQNLLPLPRNLHRCASLERVPRTATCVSSTRSEINVCVPSFTPLCQGAASCSARSSWTETDEGQVAGCSRPWAWARAGRGALRSTASSWRATVSSRPAPDTQATSWTLCWPPKHKQTWCRKVTAASLCLWFHRGWELMTEKRRSCVSFLLQLATSFFNLCTSGCAVLVAETILDREMPYAALQSLSMLVQTEGRERTKGQYADLLQRHGFGLIRTVQTSNFLDAFMACKVWTCESSA